MSDGLQVEAIFLAGAETPETYAVLARVSPGYPPLLGRLSTCYSPVRRSTRGRSRFRARLACVKHAASVHSEPGSNSPVWILYRTEPANGSEADDLKLFGRSPIGKRNFDVGTSSVQFSKNRHCFEAPHPNSGRISNHMQPSEPSQHPGGKFPTSTQTPTAAVPRSFDALRKTLQNCRPHSPVGPLAKRSGDGNTSQPPRRVSTPGAPPA
jgi:hypothetical protein